MGFSYGLGLGIGIMIVLALVSLLLGIFFLVCSWRIYVKCGVPGWHCIIPVYNMWSICNAVGATGLGVATCVVMGGTILCMLLAATLGKLIAIIAIIMGILQAVCLLATFILSIIVQYKIIEGLQRPAWFIVLAIFVPIVYYPLMAFTD